MSSAIILLYPYRDRLSYISLSPLQLEAEIAAVIAATEGFRPMPDKVGMQVAVSNIVAVAETVAQLDVSPNILGVCLAKTAGTRR